LWESDAWNDCIVLDGLGKRVPASSFEESKVMVAEPARSFAAGDVLVILEEESVACQALSCDLELGVVPGL
jgi:hypothetical protein